MRVHHIFSRTHCLSWAAHFLVLFTVELFRLICVEYSVPVSDAIEGHQPEGLTPGAC